MISKYFLSFFGFWFFAFLTVFSETQSFLTLMKPNLSIFSFVAHAFCVMAGNPNPGHADSCLCFSKSLIVLALTLGLWSFRVHFWIWCEVKVQPSLACGYPVVPDHLRKKLVFSAVCSSLKSKWTLVLLLHSECVAWRGQLTPVHFCFVMSLKSGHADPPACS